MIVVLSSAFIGSEFQAELGRLPPSFVPVANKRLYQHQVMVLRKSFDDNIYLSLPSEFVIPKNDKLLLGELDVRCLEVNADLSIGEALLEVLKWSRSQGLLSEPLRVLYGDTLITDLSSSVDTIAIGEAFDNYLWKRVQSEEDRVWAGFFAFSDMAYLEKCLEDSSSDYFAAIEMYNEYLPLENSFIEEWLDFGHVNTYFKSRGLLTTERSFNDLKIHNRVVYKSSENPKKILAEAFWFKNIPIGMNKYCPQLTYERSGNESSGEVCYGLEYLYSMPLNELWVYGGHSFLLWKRIFIACKEFLDDARSQAKCNDSISQLKSKSRRLIVEKTKTRIEGYSDQILDVEASLSINGVVVGSVSQIAEYCFHHIEESNFQISVLHGDFCFSNILYESKSHSVKVIDPRGLDVDGLNAFIGDQRYDLAKLFHSIVGLYDFIVADLFLLNELSENEFVFEIYSPENHEILNKLFFEVFQLSPTEGRFKDLVCIMILLFFSMVPLHSENCRRQKAFALNGLQLYQRFLT